MPAMNYWHESLLVTDQPGSVAVLKDLGGELCVCAVKMLAAQEVWRFPAQCTTEPTFVRGVFSVIIHRAAGRETVVQDAPLQLFGKALG